MLLHPEIPTCEDCQRWVYGRNWKRSERRGQPLRRAPGDPTPCRVCPKAEGGYVPRPENDLSPKNYQALQFYYQVKAGAPMPDDSVCRRNGGLIAFVLDRVRMTISRAALPAAGDPSKARGRDD